MTDSVYTEVCGVKLVLLQERFSSWQIGDEGKTTDLWMPAGEWDGPSSPEPISAWPEIIKKWQVQKQVEAGFKIWDLHDDRPRYWSKRDAVFRSGGHSPSSYSMPGQKKVETRNFMGDPKSLYPIPLHQCAPDTPEVEAQIEAARNAHADAVDAKKRFDAAVKAIQRLSNSEWESLPISPKEDVI